MLKLAWKNINRNLKRSILSGLTIFIATLMVCLMLSLEYGFIDSMKNNTINHVSGNVNIKTLKYFENERIAPIQFYIPNVKEKIEKLEAVDGIKAYPLTKTYASIWMSEINEDAIVIGTDFNNPGFFSDKECTIYEGILPQGNTKDVAITTKLAEFLSLKVGDSFTFLTRTATNGSNAITVKVSAIIAFNDSDLNSNLFLIDNNTLSKVLRMNNGAIEIFVYGDKVTTDQVSQILADSTLKIQNWKEISVIGNMFDLVTVVYTYIKVLFFLLASTVIINTTMMSVIERRREAATLIALGYKEKWVRNLFLSESAMISLIASLLGCSISLIIINTLGQYGIDINAFGGSAVSGYNFSNYIYLDLPTFEYITSVIFAVFIAVIACYFPTKKILKLQPAKALHDEI